MGEFKFACPVCGQHITADSTSSGSQLECPTCYRKIVVPQAPAAEGQKFILSAAEANKPRPTQTPLPSSQIARPVQSNKAALVIAIVVLLIGVGIAAYFVLQKKDLPIATSKSEQKPVAQKRSKPEKTNAPPSNVEWKLDLADVKIPDANVAGRIHGRDFNYQRAFLQGGHLSLRHGSSGLTDLGVGIYLFAKAAEDLGGQTVNIDTNRDRGPRVQLRWKDDAQGRMENFTNGYAMRLEFGPVANGRISGKIYLSTPDDEKSAIAGVFDAEIRKPTPPKPKAPNQKPKPVRPKVPKK